MFNNKALILLILCSTIGFTACAKSKQQVIKCESVKNETTAIEAKISGNEKIITEKLPKEYKSDTAINNGDIVGVHGKGYNIEKLDKFIENLENKQKDTVRVTTYTTEGDAIVNILEFSGAELNFIVDTTRDNFGSKKTTKYKAYEIVKESKNNGVYYIVKGDNLDNYPLIYVAKNSQ
ncbi:DUF4362 domain-containing protein [Clostridium manihotivorum]|uniref:DUF4362 domain-containing protein n=1 Tax=Clostridium manihotivorum TaxID=2320868 RepID=A0A3R5V8R1_9CLOT|nr:DUF4362 domain-containing protein [Clostridium manihotivorum]QAA32794.1 hypothetical protein C1I91_14730 [Clostridium manihotivorum]